MADYHGTSQFKHHGADKETDGKTADEIYAAIKKVLTGPTARTFPYAKFLLQQQREARRSKPNAVIEYL